MRPYWFNHDTNESSWDDPRIFPLAVVHNFNLDRAPHARDRPSTKAPAPPAPSERFHAAMARQLGLEIRDEGGDVGVLAGVRSYDEMVAEEFMKLNDAREVSVTDAASTAASYKGSHGE